jgi:hypothetical protein
VHIGTHKTGTTSIQSLLGLNDVALLARDIFVPRTGRDHLGYAGHHHLAWELTGNSAYNPAHGSLRMLTAELGTSPHASACISAEDLEFLYDRPDRIRLLHDGIRAGGYAPALIVYLRSQLQYSMSLYAEYAKAGSFMPLADFLNEIVRTGMLGAAPHRTQFDYEFLLEPFRAVFGDDRIIVRPYREALDSDDLLAEFLQIITPAGQSAGIALATPERLNASGVHWDDLDISETDVARLVDRFAPGNEAIARRFRVTLPVIG